MSNELPLTKSEEERIYGVEVTDFELNSALRDQLQSLDDNDCAEIAAHNNEIIRAAMMDDDAAKIGEVMIEELKALAKRRADIVLYGIVQSCNAHKPNFV